MVTDFKYDDIKLSDLGYAIVSFDGVKDGEVDTDSQYSYNHISLYRGKRQPYITSVYESPLEMEFYIAKNLCLNDSGHFDKSVYNISLRDMAFLKRWLVRPMPHKLSLEDEEYHGIYWNGSFNVEEYVFSGGRIGAKLTFECDAPFGYYEDVEIVGTLLADESFKYECPSDEIGWIYPNLTITLCEDGDLQITNAFDGRVMEIKNCVDGEVITVNKDLQIATSEQNHKIMDDFNYVYYRVNNDFINTTNTFESNLSVEFKLTYTPYAKVVAV